MRYLLLLPVLMLAACGSLDRQYVEADRATFEAIAPAYSAYVEDDGTLSDDQRSLRLGLVELRRMRLEEAEKSHAD